MSRISMIRARAVAVVDKPIADSSPVLRRMFKQRPMIVARGAVENACSHSPFLTAATCSQCLVPVVARVAAADATLASVVRDAAGRAVRVARARRGAGSAPKITKVSE